MPIIPASEIADMLRANPPLGWGHWVAHQIEIGNLEARASRGHLYAEVEDADEVDWVPGEYLSGSLLFLGKGIMLLDPVCRTDAKLIEHEGIHYFDEGYEIGTGRRVSGIETELHAFFRGEVFESHCERIGRGRQPWLWPKTLRRIRKLLRENIVVDGYYGVSSDISVVEDAEESWLPAYQNCSRFVAHGRLDQRASALMLGLNAYSESRYRDGLRHPPGLGQSLESTSNLLGCSGHECFGSYDDTEIQRIWGTRLRRYFGFDTDAAMGGQDQWPGLDAFPDDEQERRNWANRPSRKDVLMLGIEEASRRSEREAVACLATIEDELARAAEPGHRIAICDLAIRLFLDKAHLGPSDRVRHRALRMVSGLAENANERNQVREFAARRLGEMRDRGAE